MRPSNQLAPHQCRTPKRACKLRGERRVGDRHRRGRIDGAGELRRASRVRDQPHQIVALDPRHPLPARAERPAEAELERRQQARDEAALGAQHQTNTQADEAHAMRGGGMGGLLPGLADTVGEAVLAEHRRDGGLGCIAKRTSKSGHGRAAIAGSGPHEP